MEEPIHKVIEGHGGRKMGLTEDVLSGIHSCDEKIVEIIGQGGGTRDFIGFCQNITRERNI